MKGMVLDIQRFAVDAGPGIRTVVLMKGCPLRCTWCHSPESQRRITELAIEYDRCAECPSMATERCPVGIRYAEKRPEPYLERGPGRSSTLAAAVHDCPEEAISRMGAWQTVESVLSEVERDRSFFAQSGGGLTVSGGEPMAQFPFTEMLLREARARGFHTCLDTSGHAPQAHFAAILPSVDLFLFDYKATDPDMHRRLTGVPNETILANLKFLYENGARIILRAPLVPGVNDSPDHLSAIAALTRQYPDLLAVEIVAYKNMGEDKATRIGKASPLIALPTANEATRNRWIATLHDLGCAKATLASGT